MGLDLSELNADSHTGEKWSSFADPELNPKPHERRELAGVFENLELVDPGLKPEPHKGKLRKAPKQTIEWWGLS